MALLSVLSLVILGVSASHAGYYGHRNCAPGRDVLVHLFEWKWSDIAAECERFLGPKGFCGLQISPPHEHRLKVNPWRTWWQRYQPVSYKLVSRSGNEAGLRDMVARCNNVGVRVYADVLPNHMTNSGSGTGSGGTAWNGNEFDYPGVPYRPEHFNQQGRECLTDSGSIEDYQDAKQVRDCRLGDLRDLKQSLKYVTQKLANYLNSLIDMGVAGFRVDAAKHVWPADLENIYDRLHSLPPQWFGNNTKAYIYQEVIDRGYEAVSAAEYTPFGRVTEFLYSINLSPIIRGENGRNMTELRNFGDGFMDSSSAVVSVDNHDNQRGHGINDPLTFKSPRLYKMAIAFKMAWPYGHVRMMSSYNFTTDWQGPPSDADGNTDDVPISADGRCLGGWVCEHRWPQITNMVAFHNAALDQPVSHWWDNGNNAIAFSRGNKAFIVINNEANTLEETLQTGLPAGSYCDVISGSLTDGKCTGTTVIVDRSGRAHFSIAAGSDGNPDYDSFVAIHVNARLS